jgi:hypothetical protein
MFVFFSLFISLFLRNWQVGTSCIHSM